ncbi:MAG: M23 family metallopeptidase [Spirochaetota bacterium]
MKQGIPGWFYAGSILLGLLLSIQAVFPFEWPLNEPQVLSTFGSPLGRSYKKGIDIASTTSEITPIEGGEVIFRGSEYALGTHDIPLPLGNMLVLQHERGIRSVYGHLSATADQEKQFYDISSSFGRIGNTGMIRSEFVFLQIIDSEVNRFVNPMLSLPLLEDDTEPQLDAVTLQADGSNYQLSGNTEVVQGEYRLLVETFDVSSVLNSLHRMAPYSIKVYLNGEEQISLGFESLSVNDWSATPTSQRSVSAARLYSDQWTYNLGQLILQPGVALIEVFVSDFTGNETVETYRLQVTAR